MGYAEADHRQPTDQLKRDRDATGRRCRLRIGMLEVRILPIPLRQKKMEYIYIIIVLSVPFAILWNKYVEPEDSTGPR